MKEYNLLEMANEIHAFIKKFEKKYGEALDITIGISASRIKKDSTTISSLEKLAITQMHQRYPELSFIKSFKYKTRKVEFMRYSQAFQYIAFNQGYSKCAIARHIDRTHASIINSIRQVNNYQFYGCPNFAEVYLPLLKKTNYYVGSISNDTKGQTNSKSISTSVRDKK